MKLLKRIGLLLLLVAIAIHPLLETGASAKLGTTKKGAHEDQPAENQMGRVARTARNGSDLYKRRRDRHAAAESSTVRERDRTSRNCAIRLRRG